MIVLSIKPNDFLKEEISSRFPKELMNWGMTPLSSIHEEELDYDLKDILKLGEKFLLQLTDVFSEAHTAFDNYFERNKFKNKASDFSFSLDYIYAVKEIFEERDNEIFQYYKTPLLDQSSASRKEVSSKMFFSLLKEIDREENIEKREKIIRENPLAGNFFVALADIYAVRSVVMREDDIYEDISEDRFMNEYLSSAEKAIVYNG